MSYGWWKAEDGAPYCLLANMQGRLVNAAGDEWKAACEAHELLTRVALADRAREIQARADKRGGGDPRRTAAIKAEIEHAVMAQWKWLRARREARAGV